MYDLLYLAKIQLFENKQILILRKLPLKLSKLSFSNAYYVKLSFDIFTVIHLQTIFMEYDLYLISYWYLA